VSCVGQAVDSNKHLHAYRDWRGRLILFEDVDITTMIEVQKGDKRYPVGHIVRAANRKTFRQVHDEIRQAQTNVTASSEVRRLDLLAKLPAFLRRRALLVMSRQPQLIKEVQGTVIVSAVGMFGSGGGWALASPSHTLGITVGGISEKPGAQDGRIDVREYLSMTLDFDHDIVDGAPASRFAERLRHLIESGHGLPSA
jgi:pyruvate/2-oxoglutarate dehydrogenase complex dihydrolipoamide acyltransferase (E2) component